MIGLGETDRHPVDSRFLAKHPFDQNGFDIALEALGAFVAQSEAEAFRLVFDPYNIVVMVAASVFGLFVGAVPGLTATMATALLVPITFFMPPVPAVAPPGASEERAL